MLFFLKITVTGVLFLSTETTAQLCFCQQLCWLLEVPSPPTYFRAGIKPGVRWGLNPAFLPPPQLPPSSLHPSCLSLSFSLPYSALFLFL